MLLLLPLLLKMRLRWMRKRRKMKSQSKLHTNVVDKSLELFHCSPLKDVKPDRTLQIEKRKISKVTNAFSKAVTIALDEPALGQSIDCLNCCWLVELIKEKVAITEDRGEIIQLLTIVPCDLSISKVAEVFNFSEYTAKQACEWDCEKEYFLCQNKNKGLTSLKRPNKLFLDFMRVKKSVIYSQGRKIVLGIQLPDKTKITKQKRLLLSKMSDIYAQFKQENPGRKIVFSTFALYIPVDATQHLCLHLSPKCKTHAGSNDFFL